MIKSNKSKTAKIHLLSCEVDFSFRFHFARNYPCLQEKSGRSQDSYNPDNVSDDDPDYDSDNDDINADD